MILKAGFHFSVSFLSPFFFASSFLFFLLFCCFTKMTRVFPQLQTCFQFISLFIYLCILFTCHRAVVVVLVVVTHRLRLKRLFASVATVCFEVDTSGCEAPSFLPGVLHRHSQFNTSKVIETFEAHPTLATPARNRSCRHFSFPWCTPYVNVKLSGACAELKITYQLYGLSIRNPIRKVRIAGPL